ncbi:MAG: MBL fold metallo-hydrolase [Rhodospirillaceae bacterium]
MSKLKARVLTGFLALAPATADAQSSVPGAAAPNDHPAVTVDGQTYTPASILNRNMGTPAEQEEAFTPHRIIGNIYYVGLKKLSSFLIVTNKGNILLDTTYERNVPTIMKSVEQLGFKPGDIRIILGNHAHGDHMEGDAAAKQVAGGAQVIAMAQDVPMLKAIQPGGKAHPIDRVINDGDTVVLGNTTLTAHLVAGHTPGCTAWTMTAMDGGKPYNVIFGCSLRAPAMISPPVEADLIRSFKVIRALPCDVMLGDHPAQYGMAEKFAKVKSGAPNPFIDKPTCTKETDIQEAMFHAVLKEQAASGKSP